MFLFVNVLYLWTFVKFLFWTSKLPCHYYYAGPFEIVFGMQLLNISVFQIQTLKIQIMILHQAGENCLVWCVSCCKCWISQLYVMHHLTPQFVSILKRTTFYFCLLIKLNDFFFILCNFDIKQTFSFAVVKYLLSLSTIVKEFWQVWLRIV